MNICFSVSKVFKLIDIFSGNVLEKANIYIVQMKQKFIEKGNGFYVATDLQEGEYTVLITLTGYETKSMNFYISSHGNYDAELIGIVPKQEGIARINGVISLAGKIYNENFFYYTLCCEEYKKRVVIDIFKENTTIKLQIKNELSLEGRKFAVQHGNSVYSLGAYDYVEKKHKIETSFVENIAVGEFAYLLFESKTNKKGQFEVLVPTYLLEKDSGELFFFIEGKTVIMKFENNNKEYLDIKA